MREPNNNELFALYQGLTDDDHWRAVLGRACAQLDATGLAIIVGADRAAPVISRDVPGGEADAIRNWLCRSTESIDGLAARSQSTGGRHWLLAPGTPVAGIAGRHCVAPLDSGAEVVGYADLYRAPGAPEFDAVTVAAYLSLVPHLAQALALAVRVAAAEAAATRCARCQDVLPFACVLLDGSGFVLEMNGAAAELLASGDGIALVDGRLRAPRPVDEETLRRFLGNAPPDASRDEAPFASLPRPSGRRRYALFRTPIASNPSTFARRAPHQRIVIVDPESGRCVPRELLRAIYELTETESWVAWHLAAGKSLEEVAQRLGIAHNTARHHLERIFAKTGTHRQPDLVRLIDGPFVSLGARV